MNIDNFKCPICLEIYCDAHKPCVLICGHTCCIEHIKNIQKCSICKWEIKDKSFKEAIFLKDMAIEYITMHKTIYVDEYNYMVTKMNEFKIRDCEKKIFSINKNLFDIEADLSHSVCEIAKYTAIIKKLEEKKLSATKLLQQYIDDKNEICKNLSIVSKNLSIVSEIKQSCKTCNNKCHIFATHQKCCFCMDKRPYSDTYLIYVDGYGDSQTHLRNIYYCPSCKILPITPEPESEQSDWYNADQRVYDSYNESYSDNSY